MYNIVNIIRIIIIVILLRWVYLYMTREKFDNILPECRKMTPAKLLSIFNNDIDKITKAMIENNIPMDLIKNISSYPYIASVFAEKGIIKCN